ncbi:hypothetical protein QEJ31_07795 [Pigmentibacter sp. JX0631]|uniref:hypothetical protein n=1 Tax=Pigmentibacter sp. JX0631 TaxID=2976982 RepID=UPI002469B703|nr:hypothetical protein [Pigmentibacter sp. JX0631]WGL61491.1 hypothetical protein QEJ31_07795 [Pigmentibacter sp. JX0631]
MKIFLTFILIIFELNVLSKDSFDNYITLKMGSKFCISNKKILEIKNLSDEVLSIKNNILNNKICIYPVKIGNGYLELLLSDGRKRLNLVIQILPNKKEKNIPPKNRGGNSKITIFDKNLKKKYVIDGWK